MTVIVIPTLYINYNAHFDGITLITQNFKLSVKYRDIYELTTLKGSFWKRGIIIPLFTLFLEVNKTICFVFFLSKVHVPVQYKLAQSIPL